VQQLLCTLLPRLLAIAAVQRGLHHRHGVHVALVRVRRGGGLRDGLPHEGVLQEGNREHGGVQRLLVDLKEAQRVMTRTSWQRPC
jgi:hypothetical protein